MATEIVPPSSPPHAPTLLSSPFLEPWDRGVSPTSSEPPLFSSDDAPEAADVGNYESPRIYKRKRAGPWWETENGEPPNAAPENKKAKISRNFDSGVWMMSDGTDTSDDSILLGQHHTPFPVDETRDERIQRETRDMTQVEAAFYGHIQEGVDKDSQNYLFQNMQLQDSSIRHISHLNQVINAPPDPGNDVPAQGQYRSMLPSLYVNLGANNLTRLHPSLFEVQHLTSLVLRDNNITELPASISRLRHLKELDLSLNKLAHLPFEILSMLAPHGPLIRLQLVSNSLLERMGTSRLGAIDLMDKLPPYSAHLYDLLGNPEGHAVNGIIKDLYRAIADAEDKEVLAWRIRLFEDVLPNQVQKKMSHHAHLAFDEKTASYADQVFIGRTPVSYFDKAGSVLRSSPKIPTSNYEAYDVIVQTNRGVYGVPTTWFTPPSPKSKVHSLVTLSLHSAFKHIVLEDKSIQQIWEMLEDSECGVPSQAGPVLRRAEENNGPGYGYFRTCHTCGKEYVVARAEWVEFWVNEFTQILPVLVRVCSWGCVPEDMRVRPEVELK